MTNTTSTAFIIGSAALACEASISEGLETISEADGDGVGVEMLVAFVPPAGADLESDFSSDALSSVFTSGFTASEAS
jgi:hypothetical protein